MDKILRTELCRVYRKKVSKSIYKKIVFAVPPKIASFSFGDEAMSYGDTVSIQCTVSGGDLPVNISWLHNEQPLEAFLEINTEARGRRINALTIDSVSAKHIGNYSCRAENRAGVAIHSSELRVNGLWCIFLSY